MFTTGHPEDEAFNAAVEGSDPYNPGAGGYCNEEDAGNMTPRAGSPHGGPSPFYSPHSSMPSYPLDSGSQYPMDVQPSSKLEDDFYQGEVGESYIDDRRAIESVHAENLADWDSRICD
jgi:hypothetical protein